MTSARCPPSRRCVTSATSPDGRAAQLQVLSTVSGGGSGSGLTTLVNDMRATISRDGPPPGLSVHLAGAVAINVDQQSKSGSTDSEIQFLSLAFIIVLLLLVFRALLAPLVTLIPALLRRADLRAAGRRGRASRAEGVAAGPDPADRAGARRGHRLRPVPGLPGPRGAARRPGPARGGDRAPLARVGESITFSAATVIAALLSLLLRHLRALLRPRAPAGHRHRADAAGRRSRCCRRCSPSSAGRCSGRADPGGHRARPASGAGSRSGSSAARPPRSSSALVVFGGLAIAVTRYTPSGFGGNTNAPAGSDSAAGPRAVRPSSRSTSANPTNIIFRLRQSAWTDPAAARHRPAPAHARAACSPA